MAARADETKTNVKQIEKTYITILLKKKGKASKVGPLFATGCFMYLADIQTKIGRSATPKMANSESVDVKFGSRT
eukprot:gene4525-2320_t